MSQEAARFSKDFGWSHRMGFLILGAGRFGRSKGGWADDSDVRLTNAGIFYGYGSEGGRGNDAKMDGGREEGRKEGREGGRESDLELNHLTQARAALRRLLHLNRCIAA